MSDTDLVQIVLPRSDWLDIERALMTAANYLTPGCPQSQRWFDLLGMIGRARDAATPEHEAAVLARRRLRDAGRTR